MLVELPAELLAERLAMAQAATESAHESLRAVGYAVMLSAGASTEAWGPGSI